MLAVQATLKQPMSSLLIPKYSFYGLNSFIAKIFLICKNFINVLCMIQAIDLDGSEKSYNFTNLAPNTDYVVTVMGQVAEMISDRGQAAAKTGTIIS